ncbi:MAG: hypothetical protein IPM56_17330 [Ignavibacteriales bacterium]|nr:MAG: hypothetical protein IPM56_17330 [Ignavibacteriales bacterium]
MRRVSISVLFLTVLFLFTTSSFAQTEENFHVMHIQTWKMKSLPTGDDATAFADMMKRQATVVNSDSRVLRSYVLRHFWGGDSRDLVMVAEFNSRDEMFAFYQDLGSLLEKAYSKEQLDKDDMLFSKYVGEHGDEIYRVVNDTRK